MPYARVNMAEFKSREEMDRTIGQLRNNIKSIYPEIRAFASMETSETSQLTEPPLVCRRLITSSHATISNVSNCA